MSIFNKKKPKQDDSSRSDKEIVLIQFEVDTITKAINAMLPYLEKDEVTMRKLEPIYAKLLGDAVLKTSELSALQDILYLGKAVIEFEQDDVSNNDVH